MTMSDPSPAALAAEAEITALATSARETHAVARFLDAFASDAIQVERKLFLRMLTTYGDFGDPKMRHVLEWLEARIAYTKED